MAAPSLGRSSSSSSGGGGGRWKYDVFLNFKGEDTRKMFVSHLYKALVQKAITTFIDAEELRKGNKLSELLKAIGESRVSIVVFSENYASSTWCLKELVQIMECMDTQNQIVVPIFYQVDPSHVRKLEGNFAKAFAKHEKHSNGDVIEVQSWRSAVTRATNLSGWDSRHYRDDAKLIDEIVEDVFRKLIHIWSSRGNGLVGMVSHLHRMELLLCPRMDNDVRIVGIWGMGGIGKTTIARAVYDKIACQFEHYCFLEDVKDSFKKHGARHMQEDLLSRLLNENVRIVGTLNRGYNMVMKRMSNRKVLIVLDDADNWDQIETLLGKRHSFGGGSRIIISTRDKGLLSAVDETYEPKFLSYDEALELFMQYAFRTNQSTGDDYDYLSMRAIKYAQGLPLALKVLGAFLDNKSLLEWQDVLEKIKKIPHMGIQDVLRTSFDGLDDSERNIFLDIACFFKGTDKHTVTKFLDNCGFYPHSGLRVLLDKALVTITDSDTLEMHDLLQEMGREVVRQESIEEPGRRSRLWSYADVHDILTQNTATEAVEGIILDLSNLDKIYFNPEVFARMKKLRLLKIFCENSLPSYDCKLYLIGDVKFVSHELRWLVWYGCPLQFFPSDFHPKKLVALEMRCSHIEQLWEQTKPLKKLEFINLSHSRYLKKTPDVTEAKNLEKIILEGCTSLFEVHPSILTLENLVFLSLKDCKQIKVLPSSIHMKSLKTFILSGCTRLVKFPEISGIMKELSELYLDETAIKELPSSIEYLRGLVTLYLRGCAELKSLPSSICRLQSLRYVTLSGCSQLDAFPNIVQHMEGLIQLYLDGTSIKKFSPCISVLKNLVSLSLKGCKALKILPDSIHMKSLKTLDFSACSNLEKFPEISEIMEELSELHLDETAIKELPSSVRNLTGLLSLSLKNCRELKSLPCSICELKSLRYVSLSGCTKLEVFPEIVENMEGLRELHLDGTSIKELSSSIERLQGLTSLSMRNCKSLVRLPGNICNLAYLTRLTFSGCSKLSTLPENLGSLESLRSLSVKESGIKELPFSISHLKNLTKLECNRSKEMTAPFSSWSSSFLSKRSWSSPFLYRSSWSSSSVEDCGYHGLLFIIKNVGYGGLTHLLLSDCNVTELSDGIAILSSLESLHLARNNFESLPTTMNQLHRLKHLQLEACKRLKSIPKLSSSIRYLDAHNCIALETVSPPKPPYLKLFFTFCNCIKLVQKNPFIDILESHFRHQGNDACALTFNMCLPGTEILDWFSNQCSGSSVTAKLPSNWFNSMFSGLAVSAVTKFKGAYYASDVSAKCSCTLKGKDGEYSFSFYLLSWHDQSDRSLESDHMFLGYVPWSKYISIEGEQFDEATFEIVVENGIITSDFTAPVRPSCIRRCGVHFFYANHEQVVHQNRGKQIVEAAYNEAELKL